MNAILIATALTAAVQTNPLIDNDNRSTTVIVFDNGAFEAEPIRTVGASQQSRDQALAHAFDDARAQCNGDIRQMGFDTHDIGNGFAAELYFTCRTAVDLSVY